MATLLDSDELANRYRAKTIRLATRELLISRLSGSEQESDLSIPPNCDGYGRIRHFRNDGPSSRWSPNPLPIEPARRALGLPATTVLRAQAFQNAACNWRCWYCYVPFNLLAADETRGGWLTPDALVQSYTEQVDPPPMIDLTGGQPDLVPEWIPWTMDALDARGLASEVFLWSDDNLSNDFFWTCLSDAQIERVASWRNYGKVCCFKGFDARSFSFNTCAAEELFARQFTLMGRLLDLGLDIYAYVTLTAADGADITSAIPRFLDRLQELDPNLPLRTVPLEIGVFSPVRRRLDVQTTSALQNQWLAVDVFKREIERRFTAEMRSLPVTAVPLRKARKRAA
jgi:uncharacterized Fe-S cluster-containing radical SAM superfamily protein